ncbi:MULTISPECIES: sensor domain-containing diguanylate cyclase [Clostridioides]|uniref:sensor domain-containing diguanylate cyclase n=1 Tax=Clostridioides sp. ZZV14-6387 TaxID=2811497 RepID=UPI0006BC0459|nr:diguanylate cyclase [Clostridioides difficile]MCC0693773.1 diguanylate cyclase [Clostridioides sp. ZZV14-6387]MDB3084808.1 PAS domain S-box protein [Clostridioides difficile]MDI0265477.1 diguanylate cyclase [Clostridioides difficile]NJI78883.1 diguanylate cyclase [Clostridioides difficile]
MSILLKKAPKFAKHIIINFYVNRDIDEILKHLSKDITWIGPGEQEFLTSFNEIKDYFYAGQNEVPSCDISNDTFEIVSEDKNRCMVLGKYTVSTKENAQMVLEVNQRCTFEIIEDRERLLVKHMHISNPYGEMQIDEYFPTKIGTQSYDYLQRLLKEKTEVIEMITNNINGGLKGSNDDDTFSFFYVNEGLPKILGYTYDEFIEMSGGTAVGAVYPPDLPKALGDCERCFANGTTYSTEYRIRKKDGTLMWVLDSGMKSLNNDGVVKINSIITDITQLKNIESELKLERERYRIALQNITDIMFEYDIGNDNFIKYQRVEIDKKIELENFETKNYSKLLESGAIIHLDDIGKLLEVLRGNLRETIEIRQLNSLTRDEWRWIRVQCSVIYDSDHNPIKTIGVLKDITEDKSKLEILINQAQRDPLTQLYNQRVSENFIQEYFCSSDKKTSDALLVIDIDDFKTVNDTFGHLEGNEVLVAVSKILLQNTCDKDIVARIGGDEFMIFIKSLTNDLVIKATNNILNDTSKIKVKDNHKITLSIGIAFVNDSIKSYKDLFSKADKALYISKAAGKNRYSICE